MSLAVVRAVISASVPGSAIPTSLARNLPALKERLSHTSPWFLNTFEISHFKSLDSVPSSNDIATFTNFNTSHIDNPCLANTPLPHTIATTTESMSGGLGIETR